MTKISQYLTNVCCWRYVNDTSVQGHLSHKTDDLEREYKVGGRGFLKVVLLFLELKETTRTPERKFSSPGMLRHV